jgi:hypothetical protein
MPRVVGKTKHVRSWTGQRLVGGALPARHTYLAGGEVCALMDESDELIVYLAAASITRATAAG